MTTRPRPGRTSRRDATSTTWVVVLSPAGVPPETPVLVVRTGGTVLTGRPDTVPTGTHSFELDWDGGVWSAKRQLDEARPNGDPYEIELQPERGGMARSIVQPRGSAPLSVVAAGKRPDARTVVYVHGIGNKPKPSMLQCQWDTALFGTSMGDRTRMAYWVDRTRYVRPLDAACGDPDRTATDDDEATTTRILGLAAPALPQDGEAREAAALAREIEAMTTDPAERARLEEMVARIAATADAEPGIGDIPRGRVSARVLPLPRPARGLLARLLTRIFLKDVNDFLTNDAARTRMTDSLRERLRGGGEPFVVVAHSQGSMVAHEVLRRLKRDECDVALLVTIGSPLGMREVQDHFTRDGLPLAVPECVGRWVNVADRMDPVAAADPWLSNDYAPNARGVKVEDEVGWWRNPDSPRHPHSATGYLSTREVREAVRAVVGNSFTQPVSKSVVMRDVAAGLEDGGPDALHDVLLQLADEETTGAPRSLDATAAKLVGALRERAGHRKEGMPFQDPDRMRRFIRASLTRSEIEALRTLSAELHVKQVWANARKRTMLHVSSATVQARTANLGYAATGRGIGWAVLDSGIDATHPHFQRPDGVAENAVRAQWDCTGWGRPDPRQDGAANPVCLDDNGHGTHVAATIAGASKVRLDGTDVRLAGMAPLTALYGYRVLDENGEGDDAAIIKALDHIAETNERASSLVIHGINLSLGSNFDPRIYGCGHTPLCQELRRLWRQGVLICVAAGNEGYAELRAAGGTIGANMDLSIGDPANLEEAIAVGSVHKTSPHTYGISYFSSRGPTADGRRKPDLVAPGERILSARHRSPGGWTTDAVLKAEDHYVEMSGTSMATPHVSGVLAAFLSVRREFVGEPDRVKRILLDACTDLGRDPNMQGAGLANLVKMLVGT